MEKRKRLGIKVNILAGIIACMMLLCLIPGRVNATGTASCEITYLHSLEGVTVDLYKVGGVNDDGEIVLADAFAQYQVDLTEEDAAALLSQYILRDKEERNITPLQTLVTAKPENSDVAQVVFSNLDPAVYLVISETASTDEKIYEAQPSMLQLPLWEDDVLKHSVTIHAKCNIRPADTNTELSVLKVWKNDTEKDRPKEIQVQLLNNGKEASDIKDAVVTLNAENSWTYKWAGLDPKGSWTVVEKKVPAGYKVSQTKDGSTICLTNTYGTTPPPDNPPTHIPQTGQNWKDVLTLLAGGLFFILVGIIMLQKKRR